MAVAERTENIPTVAGRTFAQSPDRTLSEELLHYYSLALDKDPAELKQDVDSGMFPIIQNELMHKIRETEGNVQEGFVDFVLRNQPDVAEAAEFIRRELVGNVFEGHIAPDIAAILLDSGVESKLDRQIIERSIAAQRIIDRHSAKYEESWTSTVGGMVDAVVSEGLQNLLGGVTGSDVFTSAWQLRDLAKRANQLLYMNLPAEEFEKEFSAIIQRVEDMGFLTEANPFFFSQFVDMIREGGQGAVTDTATGFAGLDVALAPLSVPFTTVKGGVRSIPRTITQIGGATKAAGVVLSQAADNPNSLMVVSSTSPRMITPGLVGENLWAAPELSVMRYMEANNSALAQVKAAAFGNYVDDEIIQANAIKFLKETQERLPDFPRQEMNYEIRVDEAGNIFGGVILGRRTSGNTSVVQPYKTRANAERFAERIGGEVIETVHAGRVAYVVRKEVAIPTAGLANPTDLSQIANGFLSSIMSTTARTTVDLDGRIKQAEAQIARVVSEANSRLNKIRRGLSGDEILRVNNILRELRDDPLYNHRKTAMTETEFAQAYFVKYNEHPSQQLRDYYVALTEINDVDYYLTADRLLKDAVNNGEEMLRIGENYYRSKPAVNLGENDLVYDSNLNRYVPASQLGPDAKVYELFDYPQITPGSGPTRLVAVTNPVTRRLYHTDVLGYNVGGHRARDTNINFYIKQESEVTLGTGEVVSSRPRTFMGVRLQDEAEKVVAGFNNIAEALRKSVAGVPRNRTRQTVAGNAQLDAIVRVNNDWNPNIETIDDFIQLAEDYGLDPTRLVNYAGDNEPLIGQGFSGINTVGGHFRQSILSKARSMKPLMGYGGDELGSLDPTAAIQRGFVGAVSRYGNQNYLQNAMTGWLKAAKAAGALQNEAELNMSNVRNAFEKAEVSKLTREGIALEKERMTIRFRLNNTTADIRWYQQSVRSIADWVYGKGSKKAAAILDWASTKDPTQFFRSVAFHAKLGLFALPQLYIQASQVVNTIAIVGPEVGLKAGLGFWPMRLALFKNIPDAALQRIASVQSSFTGLTPQEFIEMRDWIVRSGRNIVDHTVIEENNDLALFKPGIGRAILDKGLIPFREGELAARITAALASRLELKAKGFTGDIFSDSVTRRLFHRQDVLTASMTSASSAPWQRSMLSMPFQFMTYNVRMMEQIFMGTVGNKAILTPKERIRLALAHVLMYGAAGVPLAGYLSDKMMFEYGGSVDHTSYELARYGALDAMLSFLAGEETALSTRLAAGEGLTDFVRETFAGEKPFVEFIGGPGAQVTLDVFGTFASFASNLFSANWDYTTYDWHRFGRNIAGYDMVYKTWVAAKTGEFISRKTQDVMMNDLSQVEAILLGAGIPLKKTDYLWTVIEFENRAKKNLETHSAEARRLFNIAREYIEDGDYESAQRIALDVGAMRQILTPYEQRTFDQRVFKKNETIFDTLVERMIRNGRTEVAEALQNYTRN